MWNVIIYLFFLQRKKTLKVLSRSVSVLRGNATRKGDDKKRLYAYYLFASIHHLTFIISM